MTANWLRSPHSVWRLLYALHVGAIGGGVLVGSYALFLLRAEKMEIVYRTEGVPFAAGPEGVPADKWRRMSTTQLEIVEPMANWLLGTAAAFVALSTLSLCLLVRLSSSIAAGATEARP